VSAVNCTRRYYLLKRLFAARLTDDSEGIWRSHQEAIAGTDLPSDFPLRSRLVSSGYSTTEDLNGADARELRLSGFNTEESEEVLAALGPLI
jgi:hypothetical protein